MMENRNREVLDRIRGGEWSDDIQKAIEDVANDIKSTYEVSPEEA